MRPPTAFTLALALGFCIFAAGCTSSSQLGEDTETQTAAPKDSVVAAPPVMKIPLPAQTSKQGFTTKEDTIEVESAQRNHRPEHKPVIMQRRATDAAGKFCVQIGAFKVEANAERVKAKLEKRYRAPVSKYFDGATRLYRVSVGGFKTQREARRFAAAMKKNYPLEYANAWVARRSE